MAHIVCVTGGLTGIFNASLALVEQLVQAGHRVTYASPADFETVLKAEHIPFVRLAPWVIQSGDKPMSRWQKWRQLRSRQDRAISALGTEKFAETIAALSPDLVLIDIEMHPHIMSAVMASLPIALLCPFISIWKRPHLPPISSSFVPVGHWRDFVFAELRWLTYGCKQWGSAQRERWRRMGLDRLSVLRRYAQQIGHPFRRAYGFSQWLVPYPHDSLPVLCLNAEELELPHDPHPLMHYLGSMVATRRIDKRVSQKTLAEVTRLLAHQQSSSPLIYCGCSSFRAGNEQFLQQVVAAVAERPHWTLVVGLGGRLAPSALGALPINVHVFDWAPQLQVLTAADCAIVNAGPHSIAECIHFGVPMLTYSLGHACQNGTAARVKYHQLGIVGDIENDSAVDIRAYLEQLLYESVYRQQVVKMRDRTQHYTANNVAASVVESLIREVKI